MKSLEERLKLLEAYQAHPDPSRDIINFIPDLSYDDAYRLQIAYKQRKVDQGDRIIGYQASYASREGQKTNPTMPSPISGMLLKSNLLAENDAFQLPDDRGTGTYVESEVGVLLKRDLTGPNLTLHEVRGAVEGFFATIEVVPWPSSAKRSNQMTIAMHNRGVSRVVIGSRMTLPNIDLRLEGVVVSVNGKVRHSATAVEAMGDPLNVVLAMANIMGRYEHTMKAGSIIITGTCAAAPMVYKGDLDARVEFTNLGSVSTRFS